MKLRQIVVTGNTNALYPDGLSSRDFNFSVLPFFQFMYQGLGRGKDFFNIKKLNIELHSNPDSTSELNNHPDGKGYIGMINQGGFDFQSYFNKDSVDRVIAIAEITRIVINRISSTSNETNVINGIIDKIIEKAPLKREQINLYLDEANKMIKNTPYFRQ
ncbi:MAG TPA: hypothetical protein VIK89_15180 [Cytophagaceae bacterium]